MNQLVTFPTVFYDKSALDVLKQNLNLKCEADPDPLICEDNAREYDAPIYYGVWEDQQVNERIWNARQSKAVIMVNSFERMMADTETFG